MTLVVHPSARADVKLAQRWYGRIDSRLRAQFESELNRVFREIVEWPQALPAVHRDVRRTHMRRFPYWVFYAVRLDAIIVLAVWHESRNPADWMKRRDGE